MSQQHLERSTRRGFTMVELACAMVLLMLGLATLSGSIVNSLQLGAVNRETALALARLRELEARISAVPFDQAFRTFNADPADDPEGEGTAWGPRFTFPDWQPWSHEEERHGAQIVRAEIRLPSAPGTGALREDADLPEFGFPRDLDGDDLIGGADLSANYLVLPMTIHLEWTGVSGPRSFDLDVLLRE